MYEKETYGSILERMLNRVSDRFDKRPSSIIWDTHSPTAIELQILYLELEAILKETYGDTASREYLILRCRERGISPYPATRAVLKGEFTPDDIDVTGQRFNIGGMGYVVTEQIAPGQYQVECETPGQVGDQSLGMMVPVGYIKGLRTAELTEVLIPGEDEEGTEDLRARYLASFDERAFGGNAADYIEKTDAIPGVGGTKVTRLWNGDIRPADMIPSDAVRAWYGGIEGTLSSEVADWLRLVYQAALQKKLTTGGTVCLTIIDSDYGPASDALVRTVQETIDPDRAAGEGIGIAPIGHVVRVGSAVPRTVDIQTSLTFAQGYGWGTLQDAIEGAVSGYLLELRKGWADAGHLTVRASQIDTRLLGIAGIVDVQGTLINGERSNLELDQYEIPVLGGVGA